MSARDDFRRVQTVLGVPPTGIPNDATRHAFDAQWDAALAEYRASQQEDPKPPPPPARLTLDPDHWIAGVHRDHIEGGTSLAPQCLVIHFTAGATGASSIEYWRKLASGICAHLVIERHGRVTQCRPFNRTCGHAGVSRWVNPVSGIRFNGVNSCAIGIELANAGDDDDALKWARKQPGFQSIRARHRNGGSEVEWEAYPAAQQAACQEIAQALVARYHLADVTGHDCIAPERKNDPGPAFPMQLLREACGFRGLPVVHKA